MTSSAVLRTYRAIRDAVADIQEAATAVDEHIGRFQIFGTREELVRAITQVESLGGKIQELDLQLRRCAPIGVNGATETGDPVLLSLELPVAPAP